MTTVDRWLLPDGVEELLPAQARRVERLRRQLLDLYRSWGYELVIPPLLEYTDSLLVGLGSDVDLLTFKVTDQLSGRAMGIRADITPQAARIDAHSLRRQGPVRLCYAGSVLHTRAKNLLASRSPIQLGAELYGEAGPAADIEIILLMLATLKSAGFGSVTLDLGHVGIYRALIADAGLEPGVEAALFDALQRKAASEVATLLPSTVDPQLAGWLNALVRLHGDIKVLDQADAAFAGAPPAVAHALALLREVAAAVAARMPHVNLYFDFAELRGYHYHTGLVFAALIDSYGQPVANGGRYDDIGAVFGRARPATGFNADLKALMGFAGDDSECTAIFAPASERDDLWHQVCALRAHGEQVICGLPGEQPDERCNRRLEFLAGRWQLQPIV